MGTVRCDGKVMSLSSVRDGVYMAGIEQHGIVCVDIGAGLASSRIARCKIPRGIAVVSGADASSSDVSNIAPSDSKEVAANIVTTESGTTQDQDIDHDDEKPAAVTSQFSVDPSTYAQVGFRPVTVPIAPTMIVTPSCQLRSICPAYPHSHLAATTSLQAADSPAIPRVHTPPKPSTVEPSTDGAQQRSGWCICCHPWMQC